MENTQIVEKLQQLVKEKLGAYLTDSTITQDAHVEVRVAPESVESFFTGLRSDSDLDFGMLVSLTAVDFMDERDERFEVVYHLLSVQKRHRMRVKIAVPESKAELPSVSGIWPGADFLERETWDMYGITFTGHPDLRRILMYDEFEGHPLRKDYPVQAKQPRIKLRAPEVRNTAVDMNRPALVSINPRKGSDGKNNSPRESK